MVDQGGYYTGATQYGGTSITTLYCPQNVIATASQYTSNTIHLKYRIDVNGVTEETDFTGSFGLYYYDKGTVIDVYPMWSETHKENAPKFVNVYFYPYALNTSGVSNNSTLIEIALDSTLDLITSSTYSYTGATLQHTVYFQKPNASYNVYQGMYY